MIDQTQSNQAFAKNIREQTEKKYGKPLEELFAERQKRLDDAVALKVPDRIPFVWNNGYFNYKYSNHPLSTPYYQPYAYKESVAKTLLDFEPDVFFQNRSGTSGIGLDFLGDTQYQWAGGPLREDSDAQFIDMQIMKENEYDIFMTDPSDYIMRYYVPRRYKNLAGLAKMPQGLSLVGTVALLLNTPKFNTPEIRQAFANLFKAGEEQSKFPQWEVEMCDMFGLPRFTLPGGYDQPPFDIFVSYLRGLKGTLIDMFRRPDQLIKAMDRLMEWEIARITPAAKPRTIVRGGGNHFQSEEFLSRKQFEKFPWPTWKRALILNYENGYISRLFMEGKNDDRLDYFLELPKASAILHFEKIDMPRAKSVLGGHLCIAGNVPSALLWGGSPAEVEEYTKTLCKLFAKDGGFILTSASSLDDAKPANVRAMIDACHKYGRYY